ncbi:MAG: GC-type dockerin domain-anchored protein [Planctomycetota bacterium]
MPHKTTLALTIISGFGLVSAPAFAQPSYLASLQLGGAGGCETQPPGTITAQGATPVQNSYGPTVHCDSFWGESIGSASARAAQGVIGIDVEHTWNGCNTFGCGPAGSLVGASASHEFDVVFGSPTNDPITVRMNLALLGNIQEMNEQYRRVLISASIGGTNSTGAFWQIVGDTIRQGMLASFAENTYSRFSTNEVSVPTNTPVRIILSMFSDNNRAYAEGGAVNFMQGLRLDSTLTGSVFSIVSTAPGVSASEITISGPDGNVINNRYAGDDQSCKSDLTTTGATLEGQSGFGMPDGNVDLDDLGYILTEWLGGTFVADLTTTGATLQGQSGFGIPDGTIDLDDLGYFLSEWLAGCV